MIQLINFQYYLAEITNFLNSFDSFIILIIAIIIYLIGIQNTILKDIYLISGTNITIMFNRFSNKKNDNNNDTNKNHKQKKEPHKEVQYQRLDNNTKLGLLFPIILSKLDLPVSNSSELQVICSLLLLLIIAFLSFLNVIGYLGSLYIINKYDISEKFKNYPRIQQTLKYFINTTVIFIIIEGILAFSILLFLIVSCVRKRMAFK